MRKKVLRLITLLILILSFTGILCGSSTRNTQVQSRFDSFLKEVFINEVQSDSVTLNYSLAHPENYGITDTETTLGEYGIDQMNSEISDSKKYLKRLHSFDFKLLNTDQQLTYNILEAYLEQFIVSGSYPYYSECLGPTTGLQAQLPILLAEFNLNDKEDIEEYLKLLPCVYDYFEDIARYEREKSEKGLYMSDSVANRIIEQCHAFTDNPEENFLIGYFNEKISTFDGLSESEIDNYEALNKKGVLNYVIPAYQMLADTLTRLLGTGTNDAGLYYYPDGQAYYEYLAKSRTGSGKSMEEMIELLDDAIVDGMGQINYLLLTDSSTFESFHAFHSYPIIYPEQILDDLKTDITQDFPAAVPVNCEIKYVPDALSEYLSPAMYLIPPMDSYSNNIVYINGNDYDTLSTIYTVVAHESYPGHLFQFCYFRNQKPYPIRNLLDFTGYSEGWGSYAEMYSFQFTGIDQKLAELLKANTALNLCLYARCDIGIHYEGWKKSKVINYTANFGVGEEAAGKIYNALIEEPGVYLPYAIGYLEIMELRDKAEKELGDKFSMKDFHQFLLETGPAQFDIIDDSMEQWIEDKN